MVFLCLALRFYLAVIHGCVSFLGDSRPGDGGACVGGRPGGWQDCRKEQQNCYNGH